MEFYLIAAIPIPRILGPFKTSKEAEDHVDEMFEYYEFENARDGAYVFLRKEDGAMRQWSGPFPDYSDEYPDEEDEDYESRDIADGS